MENIQCLNSLVGRLEVTLWQLVKLEVVALQQSAIVKAWDNVSALMFICQYIVSLLCQYVNVYTHKRLFISQKEDSGQ